MSDRITVTTEGLDKLIAKLARLQGADKELPKVVQEVTALTQERLIDRIFNDIRPHNRNGETVTDLVDTGAYARSFQTSFPNALTGVVGTNVEYAEFLEVGTQKMKGFFPARNTSLTMGPDFAARVLKKIRDLT